MPGLLVRKAVGIGTSVTRKIHTHKNTPPAPSKTLRRMERANFLAFSGPLGALRLIALIMSSSFTLLVM